ncbi:hypothetical protein V5799_006201 [Amblyomma americanum]|uniref:Uncharacterized protein n=1 Tax=Amblyomma americanum TaxID=6943 RepID=A0AAQ4DX24_AMBAM
MRRNTRRLLKLALTALALVLCTSLLFRSLVGNQVLDYVAGGGSFLPRAPREHNGPEVSDPSLLSSYSEALSHGLLKCSGRPLTMQSSTRKKTKQERSSFVRRLLASLSVIRILDGVFSVSSSVHENGRGPNTLGNRTKEGCKLQ